MSEEEIIKKLDKVINNNKDKAFMTGELNYVAMAESCKVKILDLQNQLQQKENIIKEVREYIEKYDFITGYYEYNYDDENDTYTRYTVKEELLEILKEVPKSE